MRSTSLFEALSIKINNKKSNNSIEWAISKLGLGTSSSTENYDS